MDTIKDLKEAIKDLPEDMVIGGLGHFGEYLRCYGYSVEKTHRYSFSLKQKDEFEIFAISIENAGEEPD
jgi:hypothetical protein